MSESGKFRGCPGKCIYIFLLQIFSLVLSSGVFSMWGFSVSLFSLFINESYRLYVYVFVEYVYSVQLLLVSMMKFTYIFFRDFELFFCTSFCRRPPIVPPGGEQMVVSPKTMLLLVEQFVVNSKC